MLFFLHYHLLLLENESTETQDVKNASDNSQI